MKPRLQIIVTSTRPGRNGPLMADWFKNYAIKDGRFEVELVDIADINLPLFDEPNHPIQGEYVHDHTKRWSAIADRGDSYVFVMPEYDGTPSSSFINAITYLAREWQYKAASFLSYGGVSGGASAVVVARHMLVRVRMMPTLESISIPNYFDLIDESGAFHANELIELSAKSTLDELYKLEKGLKIIRANEEEARQKAA